MEAIGNLALKALFQTIDPRTVAEKSPCTLDRFTNELFWNFKKCRAVSMEAYPYKQMSEKKFFPNVAPSPGSGPLLLAGAVAVQGVGGRGWRLLIGRETSPDRLFLSRSNFVPTLG